MSEQSPSSPDQSLRLQQFGLQDSTYERPNQDWVCGRLCEGSPCAIGPNAKGRCLATSECRPAKKGDRWVCTRRTAAAAACPCGEGPLPDGTCAHPIDRCAPVRSIRAKRRRCAFAAFALSVGVLSFFLFGSSRPDFLAPGELSNAHAQVLKANRVDDCAACHVAGQMDPRRWVRLAISPAAGAVQNDKCLVCHLAALGHDAGLPHSLPASSLAQLTSASTGAPPRTRQQILAGFAPAAEKTSDGELACATCHQEHGGRLNNIKTLSNTSCQVCHKVQFKSFADGHPEFHAVRHDRAGILFDHATHEPRIPGAKLNCAQCHRRDPVGRTMEFTGFEQACVGCHDQGKLDHHGDQIRADVHVVFQLPSMSLDKPAVWPGKDLAPGGALTPTLQFLVSGDADPATIKSLKSLSADVVAKGSLEDWDADPEPKARLGTAIKRVVKEIALPDDASPAIPNRTLLRARIARASGLPEESHAVSSFLDQLLAAADKTKSWQQHALPQLAADLEGKLDSSTAPAKNDAAGGAAWKPPKDSSAWIVDSDAVAIDFQPTHADAFDKSFIDLLARGAGGNESVKITDTMPDDVYRRALRSRLLVQVGAACLKCHAVQSEGEAFDVNWHSAGHARKVPGYVKFDHRPHLTLLPGSDKCSKCHAIEAALPATAHASATSLFNPLAKPNHGIAAHDKASCAVCHTPASAPDTCLTCHVYHMTR